MQLFSTVPAVAGIVSVPLGKAMHAGPRRHFVPPLGVHDFSGHDPSWDSDDRVPHDHDDGSENLTGNRLGRDISIADGGQRHDRPVHASRARASSR